MDRTLKQAADRLGMTRPKLIKLMREAGLLNDRNLPANPLRDKLYLRTKEGSWQHPKLGAQWSYSARVTAAGITWLAAQLGIEGPAPTPDPREVA